MRAVYSEVKECLLVCYMAEIQISRTVLGWGIYICPAMVGLLDSPHQNGYTFLGYRNGSLSLNSSQTLAPGNYLPTYEGRPALAMGVT